MTRPGNRRRARDRAGSTRDSFSSGCCDNRGVNLRSSSPPHQTRSSVEYTQMLIVPPGFSSGTRG